MNLTKFVPDFLKKERVIEKPPQVEMHPKFREYFENGWIRLVLNEDDTGVTLNGKQLYEIVEFDSTVPQAKVMMYDLLMQQATCFGMSRTSYVFNQNIQDGLVSRMSDAVAVGDIELFKELNSQYQFNALARKQVETIGLDDELILQVAMLWFITADEDPTKFDELHWKKKVTQARKEDLSLFFYTKGLTVLSRGLQIFAEDLEKFTQETIDLNLKNLEMMQLSMQAYLSGWEDSLSDEQYLLYKERAEALSWRIGWSKAHRMSFIYGS